MNHLYLHWGSSFHKTALPPLFSWRHNIRPRGGTSWRGRNEPSASCSRCRSQTTSSRARSKGRSRWPWQEFWNVDIKLLKHRQSSFEIQLIQIWSDVLVSFLLLSMPFVLSKAIHCTKYFFVTKEVFAGSEHSMFNYQWGYTSFRSHYW